MTEFDQARSTARLRDYVRIARPDHWVKNIFMAPGAALALALTRHIGIVPVSHMILAVISCCLIASANYTINEYLDAPFDRHHPLKRSSPAPRDGWMSASSACNTQYSSSPVFCWHEL